MKQRLQQLWEIAKRRRMNKKGGLTIVGLVLAFATLVVYVALLPALIDIINTATGTPGLDTMTILIISLFPFMIIIMILVSVVQLGQVRTEFG